MPRCKFAEQRRRKASRSLAQMLADQHNQAQRNLGAGNLGLGYSANRFHDMRNLGMGNWAYDPSKLAPDANFWRPVGRNDGPSQARNDGQVARPIALARHISVSLRNGFHSLKQSIGRVLGREADRA